MTAARMMFWGAFWAFLVDQASKYLVVHWMGLSQRLSIDVLPPFLNFRYGENTGINFGLFGGGDEIGRWVLIALPLAICLGLALWAGRDASKGPVVHCSAGLVIGGALGNVVDRLLYGYVLDFLNMSCCGLNNPFVFNLADVFIFAGAAGLILFDNSSKKAA